ncbi:MAG TPA: Ig-like domain-containing protein [Acidobacteriota bacterium]|nr:Ig-like domain-containing protein [Acidobacteriota bacterium]
MRYRVRQRGYVFTVGVLVLAAFFGCAQISAPPGGEEDRTGPVLIGSSPENESVMVTTGDRIALYFSEPLLKPLTGSPVFISPRPASEPRIQWKKDRIIITLPEAFKANRTYVITLNATVTDLRRNRLDSSATIAFSTGAAIDTGRVSGYLYKDNARAAAAVAALYDLSLFGDTIAYDSVYPSYLAPTNSDGFFSFRYLPEHEYRLVAFEDKNRNERPDPYREPFAVPDRSIVVGGPLPLDALNLHLATADTLAPAILSASQTTDGLVRVRLSRPIGLGRLRHHPEMIRLLPSNPDEQPVPARGFLESSEEESSTLTVFFDTLITGSYGLEVTPDSAEVAMTYDQIEIQAVEDETVPKIIAFQPEDKAHFPDAVEMQMTLSEPLDTSKITDQTFVLWQSETRTVALARHWIDRFHIGFVPEKIRPGERYRLDVTEFDLADLAGNLLGDSLTQYGFSTLDADSLGRISGEVTVNLPDRTDAPVVLTFQSVSGSDAFELPVSGRSFGIDVPGGKYLLSGFVDSNGNGRRDGGSLIPLEPAETTAFYADTVAVRARFETSGILFEFR